MKEQDHEATNREISSPVAPPTNNSIATPQQTHDVMSRDEDAAFQFVKELLRGRARYLGYPCLYDWIRGVALDEQPILQFAAGCQAFFMFLVTTLLGLFMALGLSIGISVLLSTLALMIIRRVVGLVAISNGVRGLPQGLEKLGGDGTNESVQVTDHAQHMLVAQTAGEMEQDAEHDE